MSKAAGAIHGFNTLEDFASQKSPIHKLHPVIKLIVSIAYIVTVSSFEPYSISGLLPMIFFPVIVFALSELDARLFIKLILRAMIFIIFIGIFNPIINKQTILIGRFYVSRGWIIFLSVSIKGLLTVTASLLLIATTGMNNIASALRQIKVPKLFVIQLLLTYRYITFFLQEVNRVSLAYFLKAPNQKGIHYKAWGSLVGQMLLRTFDKAERVYEAMLLRGYTGDYLPGSNQRITLPDIIYGVLFILFFILVRCVNLTRLLGNIWQ